MVVKINRGVSLYGAIIYNQRKVDEGTARIIHGNRIIADMEADGGNTLRNTLLSFENYLLANRNTEKPILHISLNPTPEDHLTDGEFKVLAEEYMSRMGYGDQPYVVYIHEDIERRHIHIVSTCVKENGEKISDAYEWNRSMKVCRDLEAEFGLRQVADKGKELPEPYLKKADYRAGDVKTQVSNILKSVFSSYGYRSFGEYSALLSCFNIEARQVKGEFDGKPYRGIIYTVTDGKGTPACTLIKSSLIGERFGYDGIERRIARNLRAFKRNGRKPVAADSIRIAMHGCRHDRDKFARLLAAKGIDVVFRESGTGRIYGVTFIDHGNREVFNGSRIGKEYSANMFEKLFNNPTINTDAENRGTAEGNSLSDGMDWGETIEQAFGLFSFEPTGPDHEEEAFARRMQGKKKRKRRSNGIS